jgi:hypothetical protein
MALAGASSMTVTGTEFTASAECRDQTVTATLIGSADLPAKKALDDFLWAVHDTARGHEAAEVVVDFTGLRFINSACLKGFVSWIATVQSLPPQAQYRIVLVSSTEILWQHRSLHALTCLAAEVVTLRYAGSSSLPQ